MDEEHPSERPPDARVRHDRADPADLDPVPAAGAHPVEPTQPARFTSYAHTAEMPSASRVMTSVSRSVARNSSAAHQAQWRSAHSPISSRSAAVATVQPPGSGAIVERSNGNEMSFVTTLPLTSNSTLRTCTSSVAFAVTRNGLEASATPASALVVRLMVGATLFLSNGR